MCNWCVAKKAINEIMKRLRLKSRDLVCELDSWECEDSSDEEDKEEEKDEEDKKD